MKMLRRVNYLQNVKKFTVNCANYGLGWIFQIVVNLIFFENLVTIDFPHI